MLSVDVDGAVQEAGKIWDNAVTGGATPKSEK